VHDILKNFFNKNKILLTCGNTRLLEIIFIYKNIIRNVLVSPISEISPVGLEMKLTR
jgi:hypothetical protein